MRAVNFALWMTMLCLTVRAQEMPVSPVQQLVLGGRHTIPAQAQASAMAVPDQIVPAPTEDSTAPPDMASLMLVESCKLVIAVVAVDSKGSVHPLHFADMDSDATTKLLKELEERVRADRVLDVTIPCGSKNLPGLPSV